MGHGWAATQAGTGHEPVTRGGTTTQAGTDGEPMGHGWAATQTQHRVAALIAQGQTNREIAAAMFITVNTVQTHVRHIFQKLAVRSRTELAAVLLATPART